MSYKKVDFILINLNTTNKKMKAFLDSQIFLKKLDSSTEFLSRNAVTVEKFHNNFNIY